MPRGKTFTAPSGITALVPSLIAHQPTRKEAIDTLIRALKELRITGIATTVPLHLELLANSAFHDATIDTTFVERMLAG